MPKVKIERRLARSTLFPVVLQETDMLRLSAGSEP